MQKDFHYHIIYALARRLGYGADESYIISYSSQYVDDNTEREYLVSDAHGEFYVNFPSAIEEKGKKFFPIATQAVSLDFRDISVQRYIYAPFHFLPAGERDGKNNITIDGMRNALCTIRDSDNAHELVNNALQSKDLYRIGIALHTYADTWSHEKFSAFEEAWNKNRGSLSVKKAGPSVGHAQFFNDPDEISKEWIDNRFGDYKIANADRALECIKSLHSMLKPGGNWADMESEFKAIVGAKDSEERIKIVKGLHAEIPAYDEDQWVKEALKFERDQSEIPIYDPSGTTGESGSKHPRFVDIGFNKDFEKSNWYCFHQAAKKQLSYVLNIVDIL